MGYPARTFYKCIGFDWCDLHSGEINFKPYLDGDPFVLDNPLLYGNAVMASARKPRICSSDVIHASPRAEQAAHYASNARRFPGDPRLRMLECHGRPVVHDPHNVPKYGFRELTFVRLVPPTEVLALLLAGKFYDWNPYRGWRGAPYRGWPTTVRGPQYREEIEYFASVFFPRSGRLSERLKGRRPRLPTPAK